MRITAKQAAEATGKSKPTILRAINSGKVSAVRDELTGAWTIDTAELHRVFPPKSGDLADADRGDAKPKYDATTEAAILRRELEVVTTERERERAQYEAQIADLRKVLAILTDQRAKAPDAIAMPPPASPAPVEAQPAPPPHVSPAPARNAQGSVPEAQGGVPKAEASWFRRMMGGK